MAVLQLILYIPVKEGDSEGYAKSILVNQGGGRKQRGKSLEFDKKAK